VQRTFIARYKDKEKLIVKANNSQEAGEEAAKWYLENNNIFVDHFTIDIKEVTEEEIEKSASDAENQDSLLEQNNFIFDQYMPLI